MYNTIQTNSTPEQENFKFSVRKKEEAFYLMKKPNRTAKKALSVFLSMMMLMTAWVFVAPEHAHAATDGTVAVDTSKWIVVDNSNNTARGNAKRFARQTVL